MTQAQSPIFSKTYDFLLWVLNHTDSFPKIERFRLGKRLEDSVFAFHECILESTRPQKARALLAQADLELDKMRFYVRLSHARKLLDARQYEYAVDSMMEIGRLLGGWLKSLPGQAEKPGDTGTGSAGRLVEQQR
ncbi:MAG: diversity-generating retroelement protein Avd [Anaerolineales bacterium]|jgi:hypothetical protein|nr:diversity-generating retroelement protein Avd [Anaerolineales bacterium]